MTHNVFSGTLNPTQSINRSQHYRHAGTTDRDHDHGWHAHVIATAVLLIAASSERLSLHRDYITKLDTSWHSNHEIVDRLLKTLAPVYNWSTDSIGFHVVVSFVSLAISCLLHTDGHCRDEGRRLCKLFGGQWSWTVNIPISKPGEPSTAYSGYNRLWI